MIYEAKYDNIDQAVMVLRKGQVAILPTDTQYAVSCNAMDPIGVAKVYAVKNRAWDKPSPNLIASIEQARQLADLNDLTVILAKNFWPGKLTLVLPMKRPTLLARGTYSKDCKVGLRVPDNEFTLGVIRNLGCPIVGTSANISGEKYNHRISEVFEDIVDAIFLQDISIGDSTPSTIIDMTQNNPKILREGAISKEMLAPYL